MTEVLVPGAPTVDMAGFDVTRNARPELERLLKTWHTGGGFDDICDAVTDFSTAVAASAAAHVITQLRDQGVALNVTPPKNA